MKIHEYQAKQIFSRHGIPIPRGAVAKTPEQAEAAAQNLLRDSRITSLAVKAQILAGGRGKAGGIKIAKKGPAEVRTLAEKLLGKRLVTPQTGPDGQLVRCVYLEQGLEITRELYVAFVVDRDARRVTMIASPHGGVDIEKVAQQSPEAIHRVHIDPILGLAAFQARRLAFAIGLDNEAVRSFVRLSLSLYELFIDEDCSLCEINPLVLTARRELLALDAKITFDDNAEGRHSAWNQLRDPDEDDPVEREAKTAGLSYVALDGDIGCLVNGAGLAMATMDIIRSYGGRPANFLDVGGGASQQQVSKAFGIILHSPKVKGIFVNIFGGIMKCDTIAEGIVAATRQADLKVPLVVRLEGTNVEEGRKILSESGLAIETASTMADGAEKVVRAVQGAA